MKLFAIFLLILATVSCRSKQAMTATDTEEHYVSRDTVSIAATVLHGEADVTAATVDSASSEVTYLVTFADGGGEVTVDSLGTVHLSAVRSVAVRGHLQAIHSDFNAEKYAADSVSVAHQRRAAVTADSVEHSERHEILTPWWHEVLKWALATMAAIIVIHLTYRYIKRKLSEWTFLL